MPHPLKTRCANCARTPAVLKTCTRCLSVQYCNPECQHEDFADHKEDCKTLKRHLQRVARAEEDARAQFKQEGGGDPFEDVKGHFWQHWGLRTYCHERFLLARAHMRVGMKNWSRAGIERGKNHYVELMRLTAKDNQGIRSFLTFALLALDKLQDCHDFLTFLFREDWANKTEKLVKKSKPGDWIYPKTGEDYTVSPLVGDGPFVPQMLCALMTGGLNDQFGDDGGALLLSLFLYQILVIRDQEGVIEGMKDKLRVEYKKETKDMKKIRPLKMTIADKMTMLVKQRDRLMTYLNLVDSMNPMILRAIVNPDPLLNLGKKPKNWAVGTPEEAYLLLLCSLDVFKFKDAVKDVKVILLTANIREDLSYDTNCNLDNPQYLMARDPKKGLTMTHPIIVTPTWAYGDVSPKLFSPELMLENMFDMNYWKKIQMKSDRLLAKEAKEEEEERARYKAEKEMRKAAAAKEGTEEDGAAASV